MNFVCIVSELGDKMLTLPSMENLIVQCNHQLRGHRKADLRLCFCICKKPVFS